MSYVLKLRNFASNIELSSCEFFVILKLLDSVWQNKK